ncbi:unnamed protein product [Merluccius merluccius]
MSCRDGVLIARSFPGATRRFFLPFSRRRSYVWLPDEVSSPAASTGPGVLGLVVEVVEVEEEVEVALALAAVVGYYPGPSQRLPEGV